MRRPLYIYIYRSIKSIAACDVESVYILVGCSMPLSLVTMTHHYDSSPYYTGGVLHLPSRERLGLGQPSSVLELTTKRGMSLASHWCKWDVYGAIPSRMLELCLW